MRRIMAALVSRTRLDELLTRAMCQQPGLLLLGLDWHETRIRTLHNFADRHRIGGVVLPSGRCACSAMQRTHRRIAAS